MHWTTMLGIFLVAIGTGLTIYGGILQNRIESEQTTQSVSQKIDDALERMQTIKSESDSTAIEAIEEVENEFAKWADSFISERGKKKIKFEKKQISYLESEILLTEKWSPLILYSLSTIRSLIEAYNQKANANIHINIPLKLPENLYRTDFIGKIEFNDKVDWEIRTKSSLPASDPPSLNIYFIDKEIQSHIHDDWLSIDPMPPAKLLFINIGGEAFPSHIAHTSTIDIENYKEDLQLILTRAVESTLHTINQN